MDVIAKYRRVRSKGVSYAQQHDGADVTKCSCERSSVFQNTKVTKPTPLEDAQHSISLYRHTSELTNLCLRPSLATGFVEKFIDTAVIVRGCSEQC